MISQLRPQQPLHVGGCRCEDELDVAAATGLECKLGAEHTFEPVVACLTIADTQNLGDGLGVIGERGVDPGTAEQGAAASLQLLAECGEYSAAPVSCGYESNTGLMTLCEDSSCYPARLILGRQSELVERRRSGFLRREEVQGENGRTANRELRRGRDLLPDERPNDEIGAFLGRVRDDFGDAAVAGVIDANLRAFRGRRLVERGHEAVPHAQSR